MIRKFLIKLLVRWYVNQLDEIYKVDPLEELKDYRFANEEAVMKIIKANLTAQTLWHFESLSDEERWMAKGAANILKIMKSSHYTALKIWNADNPDKSMHEWLKHKRINRTN